MNPSLEPACPGSWGEASFTTVEFASLHWGATSQGVAMEVQTIVTVKQVRLAALLRSIRLYMEDDYCVCAPQPSLPGLTEEQPCPDKCGGCTWCIARTALRGIGQRVDA